MPRVRTALAFALVLFSAVPGARAQPPPLLPADAPLTLRPGRGLRRFAGAVARTLSLRLSNPVSVGQAPPPEIMEAVPTGHVAMAREHGVVLLVLAGPETQVYRSEVSIRGQSGQAAVRAVALAVETLRDAALDGPPEGFEPTSTRRTWELRGHEVTWIYREPEGGIFGPRQRVDAEAKPWFYLGAVAGLTTGRVGGLVGPRIGLGLCLHDGCLSIEGDVPLLAQETIGCDGNRIDYRPVTLGLRLSYRPIHIDDVVLIGLSLGVISRFGLVNVVGADTSRLSTDFGVRSGVEVAWRMGGPFELALDVGADVSVSPARIVRSGGTGACSTVESVLVEDIVTLWSAVVLRVRP